MPADATTVLNAVEAALATPFPGTAVRQSKRRAADGRQLQGGWTEGYPTPCLVLSCAEPERVDDAPSFETVSVRYFVLIEYVKAAEAKVAEFPGKPPAVVEDAELRDVREALRQTLYKPSLAGVGRLFDTRVQTRGVYDPAGGGKLVATGIVFGFNLWETRPGG